MMDDLQNVDKPNPLPCHYTVPSVEVGPRGVIHIQTSLLYGISSWRRIMRHDMTVK
jgi:hypothetical protein